MQCLVDVPEQLALFCGGTGEGVNLGKRPEWGTGRSGGREAAIGMHFMRQ